MQGMNESPRHPWPAAPTEQPSNAEIAEIVQRAQRGEEAAFGQLYETYVGRVYRYILYRVHNPSDAEDLTEDVFLRMLDSLKTFKWRDVPFAAWLLRIAHNRVVDFWRRGSIRATTPIEDAPPIPSDEADPHTLAQLGSDIKELRAAMTHLTELQQRVLSLRFAAGLSIAETAKAMDRNDGAVKALQHSAVAALRRLMVVRDE